jgi:hypothetical protein
MRPAQAEKLLGGVAAAVLAQMATFDAEPTADPYSQAVDLRIIASIALGLLAVWAALVAVLWVVKPRDTGLRELMRVVPEADRQPITRAVADELATKVGRFNLPA